MIAGHPSANDEVGQELSQWLRISLEGPRQPKSCGGYHISESHDNMIEEIRRYMIRRLGVSRRDASRANITESAVELLHLCLFGGSS